MLEGKLPPRAKTLVEEWRTLHIKDLDKAWLDACANKMPTRIAPLK